MHQFLIVTPGFSRWKHIFSKGFYFSRLLCPAHKIWHTYDNPGAMCSALFQLKRQKRKQQHVPWIIRMYVYIFLINVQWTHYNFFFIFQPCTKNIFEKFALSSARKTFYLPLFSSHLRLVYVFLSCLFIKLHLFFWISFALFKRMHRFILWWAFNS